MASPGTLYEWIEARPEEGRYVFARPDVDAVTDASAAAIKMTLYRLKQSGAIVTPRRDFFVVVPREYRAAGCPPASWFIDDLMRHMGRRYYVGLLTAAALHGAGHQQPMAFEANMAAKLTDPAFLTDVPPILRTGLEHDAAAAWFRVHAALVSRLPGEPWKGDVDAR